MRARIGSTACGKSWARSQHLKEYYIMDQRVGMALGLCTQSGYPDLDTPRACIDLPLDISIADVAPVVDVTIRVTPFLQDFIDGKGLHSGDKYTLSDAEFDRIFAEAFRATNDDGSPRKEPTLTPGGTGANFAAGLKALLDGFVSPLFLGIVPSSDGVMEELARKSLSDFKVRSFRHESAKDLPALTNFVVKMPDGDRIILKRPLANPEEVLNKVLFENKEFRAEFMKARLLYLADNTRIRAPEFDDQLLSERWNQNQILCYSGPTDEKYAREHSDHIRWILESVNVALLNTDELRAAYHIDKPKVRKGASQDEAARLHNPSICQALNELQASFRKGALSNRENFREQVGFITDGEFGAYVVTADGW
jgi:hypothetical protein